MNASSIIARTATALIACIATLSVHAVPDDGGRPQSPPSDPPSLSKLEAMIADAMPSDIKENNAELLERLRKPRIAPRGPSEIFNAQTISTALRLRRAIPDKGCFLPPPRFACELTEGSRDGGGAFKKVEADSLGNVSFLSRLPDPSLGKPEGGATPPLPSFSLTDAVARQRFASLFSQIFGVPLEEAPAASGWAVDRLQLGLQDAENRTAPPEIKEIAGVVTVPRMLLVDGLSTPMVPVLGSHVQGAMDDLGSGLPFRVEVQGWTRFTFPDSLGRARPMTKTQLVSEIANDLIKSLRETPRSIAVEIAYAKVGEFTELGSYGGPDSDEGAPATSSDGIPDAHRYVPVIITSVSPMSADASEEEQGSAFSTAGVEFVTPLFAISE